MTTSHTLKATQAETFDPGGYKFLPSVFQFSGGVAATQGWQIERVVLRRPLPIHAGLDYIENHLAERGRPPQALCACELRSPGQFNDEEFRAFNRSYVARLEAWGIMREGDINPVARTNVCPTTGAPAETALHAFAYTVPSAVDGLRPDFIIAGGAEAPERGGSYREAIIRRGDTSLDGLREKLRYVRDEQLRRLTSLGVGWGDADSVRCYSMFDVGPLLYSELLERGIAASGLSVQIASPPVEDCVFEMDARRVTRDYFAQ